MAITSDKTAVYLLSNSDEGLDFVDDVAAVLNANTGDLCELCTHANINMWAPYKPMAVPNHIDLLTEAQRKAVRYGLSVSGGSIASLLAALKSEANTQPAPESLTMPQWVYTRPWGGDAAPYRLLDFLNGDSPTDHGYDATACAPDSWQPGASVVDTAFAAMTNTFGVASQHVHLSANSDMTQWHIDAQGGRYAWSHFSIRFGKASHECIGAAPFNAMPLTFLMGDMLAGSWRLALAVYLPKGYAPAANPKAAWGAFCGMRPLSSSADMGQMCPNFATNTHLLEAMRANYNSGVKEFTMVPCMLKSTTLEYNTATQKTRVVVGGNVSLETMPSGVKSVKYTITADTTIGQLASGSDSTYKYSLYSPIKPGEYKVVRTVTTNGASPVIKIYRVTIARASITIKHDASLNNASGNMAATVANATGATVGVSYYASEANYQAGITSTDPAPVVSSPTINNIWQYFAMYGGANVPASARSFSLQVTPIRYL